MITKVYHIAKEPDGAIILKLCVDHQEEIGPYCIRENESPELYQKVMAGDYGPIQECNFGELDLVCPETPQWVAPEVAK